MKRNSKAPKNTIELKINRQTNKLYLTWNRNPEQINSIIENLDLFKLTPTENLKDKIKSIALHPTKRSIIDIFTI